MWYPRNGTGTLSKWKWNPTSKHDYWAPVKSPCWLKSRKEKIWRFFRRPTPRSTRQKLAKKSIAGQRSLNSNQERKCCMGWQCNQDFGSFGWKIKFCWSKEKKKCWAGERLLLQQFTHAIPSTHPCKQSKMSSTLDKSLDMQPKLEILIFQITFRSSSSTQPTCSPPTKLLLDA